jgi:hypothetical protein
MRACGFVLELGFHLPFEEGLVVPQWSGEGRDEERTDAFYQRAIGEFPPLARRTLGGWLEFRSADVAVQIPLAAADLAFGHLDHAARSTRLGRLRRRVGLRLFLRRRPVQRVTAVAAFTRVARFPEDGPDLTTAFISALAMLNDWLVAVGVAADRRLRPLQLSDFPPLVPCIRAEADADGNWSPRQTQMFVLRDFEQKDGRVSYAQSELDRARVLFEVLNDRGPFATFYEVVQRANAALAADRGREAVIDFCTAGEIFITEVVRQAGRRKGLEPGKLENIIGTDFKGRATHHLGRLIGAATDPALESAITRLWWIHCYERRHDVVHRGADVPTELAEFARIGLVTLVVEVREVLRADPALRDIAPLIQWGWRVDETGGGGNAFPDPVS